MAGMLAHRATAFMAILRTADRQPDRPTPRPAASPAAASARLRAPSGSVAGRRRRQIIFAAQCREITAFDLRDRRRLSRIEERKEAATHEAFAPCGADNDGKCSGRRRLAGLCTLWRLRRRADRSALAGWPHRLPRDIWRLRRHTAPFPGPRSGSRSRAWTWGRLTRCPPRAPAPTAPAFKFRRPSRVSPSPGGLEVPPTLGRP